MNKLSKLAFLTAAKKILRVPSCPSCGSSKYKYDSWEDMYRCEQCEIFYYPGEGGVPENRDAGIYKLGKKK